MPRPPTPGSRPSSSHRQSTPGPLSRPSSRSSTYSLTTTPRSSVARDSLADELAGAVGPIDGLGDSLANELGAGEWSEQFEGEYFEADGGYDGESYGEYDGNDAILIDQNHIHQHHPSTQDGLNTGPDVDHRPANSAESNFPSYDGSEYGDPGLSAELDVAIRKVGHVIRQSIEHSGIPEEQLSPTFSSIPEVPQELTSLPSQAAVEAGVTRLVATHGALAGHVTHQTRVVASLGSALLSPLAPPVPPEEAAELAALLGRLLIELPRPTILSAPMPIPAPALGPLPVSSASAISTSSPSSSPSASAALHTVHPNSLLSQHRHLHHPHRQHHLSNGPSFHLDSDIPPVPQSALVTLHNLYASAASMLGQLSQLTDSLHVFRQSHAVAAKRLASTRSLVHSLRREMDEADRAEIYLAQGDWDRKLRERVVSLECRRVVDGFESAWRGRLSVLEDG